MSVLTTEIRNTILNRLFNLMRLTKKYDHIADEKLKDQLKYKEQKTLQESKSFKEYIDKINFIVKRISEDTGINMSYFKYDSSKTEVKEDLYNLNEQRRFGGFSSNNNIYSNSQNPNAFSNQKLTNIYEQKNENRSEFTFKNNSQVLLPTDTKKHYNFDFDKKINDNSLIDEIKKQKTPTLKSSYEKIFDIFTLKNSKEYQQLYNRKAEHLNRKKIKRPFNDFLYYREGINNNSNHAFMQRRGENNYQNMYEDFGLNEDKEIMKKSKSVEPKIETSRYSESSASLYNAKSSLQNLIKSTQETNKFLEKDRKMKEDNKNFDKFLDSFEISEFFEKIKNVKIMPEEPKKIEEVFRKFLRISHKIGNLLTKINRKVDFREFKKIRDVFEFQLKNENIPFIDSFFISNAEKYLHKLLNNAKRIYNENEEDGLFESYEQLVENFITKNN